MTLSRSSRLTVLAAAACATASCTYVTGKNAAYVVVEPEGADQFLKTMGTLTRENGLTPYFMESTYPQGAVLHILEGSGWSLRLWFANMPLSGQEDQLLCGKTNGIPYPDPAQFLFYVEPRLWGSQAHADEVRGKIVAVLKAEGYDVRETAVLCGLSALATKS